MSAKVILLCNKHDEINNFLNKFYSTNSQSNICFFWQKEFRNPVEISEMVAAFVDNSNSDNLAMWVSLDKDVFIKISPSNANIFIKYLFERYPY